MIREGPGEVTGLKCTQCHPHTQMQRLLIMSREVTLHVPLEFGGKNRIATVIEVFQGCGKLQKF